MLTDDERHRLTQLEGKADAALTMSERSELDALRHRRHESPSRHLRAIRRDPDLDDTTRPDSDDAIQRDPDLN